MLYFGNVPVLSATYGGVDIATRQLELWMYYVLVFRFNVVFERHLLQLLSINVEHNMYVYST